MNYSEITTLAIDYSNRTDVGTTSKIDSFLRVVESRINRLIKIQKMSTRAILSTAANLPYYTLPSDFAGLRDIEYIPPNSTTRYTLSYKSPEQLNNTSAASSKFFYTLIADQIQVAPTFEHGGQIEIIYYKKVPPLTSEADENWVSSECPDAYVFGILVEINSFVKDKEAAVMWDKRFLDAIDTITLDDGVARWSGTSLEMRTG